MTDLGDIFLYLWNGLIALGEIVGDVWQWLTDEHLIGFTLPVIGDVGISIVPMSVIGVGFIAIMILWLIKALVPLL